MQYEFITSGLDHKYERHVQSLLYYLSTGTFLNRNLYEAVKSSCPLSLCYKQALLYLFVSSSAVKRNRCAAEAI
jgi:hypothetical protein